MIIWATYCSIVPLFYYLTSFKILGQKFVKIFFGFLENLEKSKRHSEFNWPLCRSTAMPMGVALVWQQCTLWFLLYLQKNLLMTEHKGFTTLKNTMATPWSARVFSSFSYNLDMHNFSYMKICMSLFFK